MLGIETAVMIVPILKSGGANILNEFRLVWPTSNKVPVGNERI